LSTEPEIGFYFKKIHDSFVKTANAELKNWDLTFSQMEFLIYLLDHSTDKVTHKNFEQHFNLKHPTVIGILKRLEKKELIEVTINKDDRRSRIINTTEKADEIERVLTELKSGFDELITQGLSEVEIQLLSQLLCKVYQNVE